MTVATVVDRMDAATVLETVREENGTRLDRLGSERALVAGTHASIERERVLETAIAAEARAAATFEALADDEPNEAVREAFAAAADREREHVERVAALGDAVTGDPDPAPDALHEHLRELDGTVPRVGAASIGRPLVASRTLLQVINFFVNDGDEAAAGTFRDLREETDEQASTGATLAVEIATDEAALDRALAAAGRAIDVAYDEYADRLTEMGVDPKPVC